MSVKGYVVMAEKSYCHKHGNVPTSTLIASDVGNTDRTITYVFCGYCFGEAAELTCEVHPIEEDGEYAT